MNKTQNSKLILTISKESCGPSPKVPLYLVLVCFVLSFLSNPNSVSRNFHPKKTAFETNSLAIVFFTIFGLVFLTSSSACVQNYNLHRVWTWKSSLRGSRHVPMFTCKENCIKFDNPHPHLTHWKEKTALKRPGLSYHDATVLQVGRLAWPGLGKAGQANSYPIWYEYMISNKNCDDIIAIHILEYAEDYSNLHPTLSAPCNQTINRDSRQLPQLAEPTPGLALAFFLGREGVGQTWIELVSLLKVCLYYMLAVYAFSYMLIASYSYWFDEKMYKECNAGSWAERRIHLARQEFQQVIGLLSGRTKW